MDNQEYKQMLIKRTYNFSLNIMKFLDCVSKSSFSSQVIAKQLIRSATSIGANIVEAQAGSSRKDFTNFITHSLKSANETLYWLGLLRDGGKADKNRANELLSEAKEISKLLGSTVASLKKKTNSK